MKDGEGIEGHPLLRVPVEKLVEFCKLADVPIFPTFILRFISCFLLLKIVYYCYFTAVINLLYLWEYIILHVF